MLTRLHFSAALSQYEQQAVDLLAAQQAAEKWALQLFHERHPRFLDERIPWLPKPIPSSEIQKALLQLADAELALARWYDFLDWSTLSVFASAASDLASSVHEFETAVEAVIHGDLETLTRLLRHNPALVQTRSTRVTHFDPPVHGATLLHYLAANGVEGYRQKSPQNAVEIAELLLTSGADPNALAHMYGGQCTTISMLISSTPPADAGTQIPLLELLIAHGAIIEPHGQGNWQSPVDTALAFGFRDAAETLIRHGAKVSNVATAAGLGRLEETQQLYPEADPLSRHRACALAAQLGHVEIVKFLLEAGEDPNRYNPRGNHQHSTPLHQAALAGHEAVVRLLVEQGADTSIEDTTFHATALGWAEHGGKTAIADYLRQKQ